MGDQLHRGAGDRIEHPGRSGNDIAGRNDEVNDASLGSRQIALARNAGQLRFGPDAECFDLCFAVLLTGSKADIGRLTCNVALGVV